MPLFLFGYYAIIFGAAPGWYFVIICFWGAIPGAIVGAVLWVLCVRFVDSLGALSRITIGVAIASTLVSVLWLYLLWVYSGDSYHDDLLDFPRMIRASIVNGVPIGALAGWLSPSTTIFRKEPEPPYWERVREYEAAQAERDYWLAQQHSGKSRERRHSA
jgi:hypothetical protein